MSKINSIINKISNIETTTSDVQTQLNGKNPTLVSGSNIKTINGTNLLGSGNIDVTAGAASISSITDWPVGVTATEVSYLDGVSSSIQTQLSTKQNTLVSGTNIRTINGNSLLGSTDLVLSGTGSVTSVTAGNGMTQSGTSSIDPTLNIVSHAGSAGTIGTLSVSADSVGVSLGTTSTTACSGADSRLSDARTPTAHNQAETTITFSDVTTGNASSSSHGFLPKLNNSASSYLNGTGAWSTVTATETDTLATVTARGATTATACSFTNSTASSSSTTGAVKITGGLGVGGNIYTGAAIYSGGGSFNMTATSSIWGTATQVDIAVGGISYISNVSSETSFYGNIRSGTDGTKSCGTSASRWSVVYAGSGTINTSDEREKEQIESLDEIEKRIANKLRLEIKKFKFKDAVLEKGTSARIHIGIIAQRVVEIFAEEDLDANDYGLLCYDEWEETPAINNQDGSVLYPAQPAGNRYGIRYEELAMFILGSL